MKTLLVIASHPALPEALRLALDPGRYRIVHRVDLKEAEAFLGSGGLDGCILELGMSDIRGLWMIERVREAVRGPLLVFVDGLPWEWEEEAYVKGVTQVLVKPLKPRLLGAVLDRQWGEKPGKGPLSAPMSREAARPGHGGGEGEGVARLGATRSLEVLRGFSSVLTHSLQADALVHKFLLLLREIIGVNRAAIFLRQPPSVVTGGVGGRRLKSACSIGLAPELLEHFELSFEAGIGGHLFRHGRILRVDSEAALRDPEVRQEFELLGAQVAIPMLDREHLIGIAAFDGRVTGEVLANGELALVFHLLEELGLAIKNIWLHDQLSHNHKMLAGILQELSSACIVVNRDLTILHANKRAAGFFARVARRAGELEFSDLPEPIGTKAYQVLQNGTGLLPFKYEGESGKVYRVTVVPFQRTAAALPSSVLVVVDDQTQAGQLQALEVEAANLRLVRVMADRLAHEVGNSLVPLATHQQLLKEKYKDPEFRASLDLAMAEGVKRISRLASQMRFLARDTVAVRDAIPLAQLLEEAHVEAQKHHPGKPARLKCDAGSPPIIVTGDRAALRHALSEVMLNALQANPEDSRVGVRLRTEADADGVSWVRIDVEDTGPGVRADRAAEVLEPFITHRNVGLGLGLTVSRKIIETHRGQLTVMPAMNGHSGGVRIKLPLEAEGKG